MPGQTEPIVVRAPLRISFGGGGTDLPSYYGLHGGFVVSAAIARYCYVVVRQPVDRGTSITSSDYRCSVSSEPGSVPTIEAPLILPRAALAELADFGLRERGIDLSLRADVRPGTGLGSSSAMAVALVRAISSYLDIPLDKAAVAKMACSIEIERLGMPIGKQDQYASAFGGLNTITFAQHSAAHSVDVQGSTDDVEIEPLLMPVGVQAELESRLLLFSTGMSHDSASILRQQQTSMATEQAVIDRLHSIKALAREMCGALQAGEIDQFGSLLDQAWSIKRNLTADISSTGIDTLYTAGRAAGALGGKITGAGGGGYMLLYCRDRHHTNVRAAMARLGAEELTFDFQRCGVQVVSGAKSYERMIEHA